MDMAEYTNVNGYGWVHKR